jgi:O-antigen/teichoic acid export membrane protein
MPDLSVKKVLYACCPAPLRPYWHRVERSPVGYRLARGSFWSLGRAVSVSVFSLVGSVLVARILGKEVFGEAGMVRGTVGMFFSFAAFGLGTTATKHVAEYRRSDPLRAGRIIAISAVVAFTTGVLMTGLLYFLAPWLAEKTLSMPALSGMLRIGCLLLLLNAMNGAQLGALAGLEAFKTTAIAAALANVLTVPVLVAATYWGGLTGTIWGYVISLGMQWVFSHVALRYEAARAGVPLMAAGFVREWRILWRFSLPATLGGTLLGPVVWAGSAMLVNHCGYGEMGIYNAAGTWATAIAFLPTLLCGVTLPIFSQQWGERETHKSWRLLKLLLGTVLAIVVPVVTIACLASPWIMAVYGRDFSSGWPTLAIVFVATGINCIYAVALQILMAAGKMWFSFLVNVGWSVTFLVSAWYFMMILDWKSFGLAGAGMVAASLQLAAVGVYTLRQFRAVELQ